MVPGEHPAGFCMEVANGPSWGKKAQRHLAKLEQEEGIGLAGCKEHTNL